MAGSDGASPPSTEAIARPLTDRRSGSGLALRQSLLVVLGIAAVVVACVALGFGWRSVEQAVARLDLSVEGIERIAEAWGAWAPVASIVLMILHSFVPFPAELIAIANGMLFGPVWGTLVTWIGAMLGAALAFALARRYGRASGRPPRRSPSLGRGGGVTCLLRCAHVAARASRARDLVQPHQLRSRRSWRRLVALPLDHQSRHLADHRRKRSPWQSAHGSNVERVACRERAPARSLSWLALVQRSAPSRSAPPSS